MTLGELHDELTKRGVLGLHVSLVGGRCSVVAITPKSDADATRSTLNDAIREILVKLPVLGAVCGNA